MGEEGHLKVKDLPQEERPRERLINYGCKALSNAELLAIILSSGTKKQNVLDLSKRLLNKFDLKSLSRKRIGSLKKILGIGEVKACRIIACFEMGRRFLIPKKEERLVVESSKDIAKIFISKLSNLKKEHFVGIYLDSRKRIIKTEVIFIGSLNTSVVHPREIFEIAIAECAAAIILVHNHPSGDPRPSNDDIEITEQIFKAGKIMGIDVLDHIIITDDAYVSLMEEGYFDDC